MANEKRLIFLDHALQAVGSGYISDMQEHDLALLVTARKKLKELPTVDAVEVVRCKDCTCGLRALSGEIVCVNPKCTKSFYGCTVAPKHFCSYGKRRPEHECI